jgi:hypothetical protein
MVELVVESEVELEDSMPAQLLLSDSHRGQAPSPDVSKAQEYVIVIGRILRLNKAYWHNHDNNTTAQKKQTRPKKPHIPSSAP